MPGVADRERSWEQDVFMSDALNRSLFELFTYGF